MVKQLILFFISLLNAQFSVVLGCGIHFLSLPSAPQKRALPPGPPAPLLLNSPRTPKLLKSPSLFWRLKVAEEKKGGLNEELEVPDLENIALENPNNYEFRVSGDNTEFFSKLRGNKKVDQIVHINGLSLEEILLTAKENGPKKMCGMMESSYENTLFSFLDEINTELRTKFNLGPQEISRPLILALKALSKTKTPIYFINPFGENPLERTLLDQEIEWSHFHFKNKKYKVIAKNIISYNLFMGANVPFVGKVPDYFLTSNLAYIVNPFEPGKGGNFSLFIIDEQLRTFETDIVSAVMLYKYGFVQQSKFAIDLNKLFNFFHSQAI